MALIYMHMSTTIRHFDPSGNQGVVSVLCDPKVWAIMLTLGYWTISQVDNIKKICACLSKKDPGTTKSSSSKPTGSSGPQRAKAGKGRGKNRAPNEEAKRAIKEINKQRQKKGLPKLRIDQEEWIHEEITGQGLKNADEIVDFVGGNFGL